jgi:phosphoglycerate dehydrogenase-like enzyme/glyoxylase-like metal-dependent hydrolase (beta-lactamase superfamily II)
MLSVVSSCVVASALAAQGTPPQDPEPVQVAAGVWFLQSKDVSRLGCNVAWIETTRGVVVIDTAFPAGAERALRAIKATSKQPIRWAVMTHHHPDHAFGSGAFAAEGALVIAHDNAALAYAQGLAAYRQRQEHDAAAKKYEPYGPDVTFKERLKLNSGEPRVELLHFGHAHTAGDVMAWIPALRVLCTGDACVQGPMSYFGDADTASWIDVLGHLETLGAQLVVPGHGTVGGPELLAERRSFLRELRSEVARLLASGKRGPALRDAVELPTWRRWTTSPPDPAHVEFVAGELTRGAGRNLTALTGDAVAIPVTGGEPPALVLLCGPMPDAELVALRGAAPNVEIVIARTQEEAMAQAGRVHGAEARFVDTAFLAKANQLRWVQAMSAGVERYVAIPELVASPLLLTNMAGMYGSAIADHALGMLLALVRGVPHWLERQRAATWARDDEVSQDELASKTMLVLGLGGIGKELARRAHACGMRVLATQARPKATPAFVTQVFAPDALDGLLPDADVVAICLPLTPATRGMFDAARLARMKRGAILVNVARGALVATDALLAALDSGALGGACLDVVDPEPLPAEHPLWAHPRVLLTPHVSGRSPLSEARRFELFAENVRRFGRGLPLLNVVDKQAGY